MRLSITPSLMFTLCAALALSPGRAWGQADNASGIMERAAPSSVGVSPIGTWVWKCCRGAHSGTFTIQSQDSEGRFSGRFGNGPSDGQTPIHGRIRGNRIEFTRSSPAWNGGKQQWSADLQVRSGRLSTVNGRWSGYSHAPSVDDFEASLTRPEGPGATLSPMLGTWRWECCRGAHSGTFTIQELLADGSLRGIFGNGPADGASPFEGTYRRGALSFTRHVTVNGRAFTQQWSARVINDSNGLPTTADGQWSGFAATPGNNDFRARKLAQ
ncbi:MAG: hypothetical protein J0L64_12885 [Acidobacteria bacterium]|nr:hypothetical protein [Acidobacteriota bacterium]